LLNINNCLNQNKYYYTIDYTMNNEKIPAFAINNEIRQRVARELSNNPQGKKVLDILKKGSEHLTEKQQETIMSYLSQYAIDATSLLIGGKLRGDIAKTIIDLIGNRMFTTMVTSYRSEYKTRANAEMITGQVKIFETNIGIPIKGIFKTIPHGYHIRSIKLFDSREDATEKREFLMSKCGMDEQRIDIFGPRTFMTYEDWHTLTRAEEKIKEAKLADQMRQSRSKRLLSNKNKTVGQARLSNKLGLEGANIDKRPTKIYSLIRKIKTKLIINNDMQCYYTNLKVYLCTSKRQINCDNKASAYTSREIFNMILQQKDQPYATNYLTENELINFHFVKNATDGFYDSLIVRKNVNIFSKAALMENVNILRTYNFNLFPTETAIIEINHNYERGIDLYDLMRTNINEACAHTFFIICSTGVDGARATHKSNDAIRFHGTSPVINRYEISRTVEFTEKDNEEDYPATQKMVCNNINFWEDELTEYYHSERIDRQTISINQLIIGNKGSDNAEYVLDFNDKYLINDALIRNMEIFRTNSNIEPENIEEMIKETNETNKIKKNKKLFIDEFFVKDNKETTLEDIEDLDNE
jgi:hypothetical protein